MKWRMTLCVIGAVSISAQVLAEPVADQAPSAQVRLVALQRGSLPRVVTAYGNVQPAASARQSIVAPTSIVVDQLFVHSGQSVSKGAPLIRLRPSPATAAAYAKAEASVRATGQLVARTRQLVAQHLATGQQQAEAEKAQADAQAELAALQAQGADSVRVLHAPSNTIVISISATPGALAAEGAPLLELAQPQGLVLKVGVMPAQAMQVARGDAVEVTPIGSATTFSAKVVLAGAAVEAGSGLVPIEIALPAGKALPGEMAQAVITVGQAQGYVVPHAAVLVDDQGAPYVVQAEKNMTAHKVPVQIVESTGGKDVVDGALDAASPVVVEGNYQLEEGMRLRLAAPQGKDAQ